MQDLMLPTNSKPHMSFPTPIIPKSIWNESQTLYDLCLLVSDRTKWTSLCLVSINVEKVRNPLNCQSNIWLPEFLLRHLSFVNNAGRI